jgi:arylsulfatase A-like enzyme
MNRREFLGGVAATALPGATTKDRRPNIVVIMADDMGISDIGCYGGEISTPNLDALAQGGVKFTQFYNCARCCPTRASLLTGLYPHQAGVGHMVNPRPLPGYRGDLNADTPTIAEVLRKSGYRTAAIGKWHVTPVNKSKHNWPLQRGFDKYFGMVQGAGDYFKTPSLALGNDLVEPANTDYYFTDAIASYAATFIDEFAAAGDKPFFAYVPFTSPHWPLHALDSDIAKYKGKYSEGWDALRTARHRRMVEKGLVDAKWQLTPRDPSIPAWAEASDKEWEQRRMEVYAAQIDRMDQGIGRIVNVLRNRSILDNTLILFLADNGGCAEVINRNAANQSIPLLSNRGNKVLPGNRPELMPGPSETYQSYGPGWANSSNTPFRMYKHWVHEGGISSPLIAHWPKGLAKPNRLVHEPAHLIDIMATCVDISVATPPPAMEGASLAPLLKAGRLAARKEGKAIYWEHEGNRAVREGKWKLVSRFNNQGKWELYDLEADRTEVHDLASSNAAKVAEMKSKWEAWANRVGEVDWATLPAARET